MIYRKEVKTAEEAQVVANVLDSYFEQIYKCEVISILYRSTTSTYEVWARVPYDFDDQAFEFSIEMDLQDLQRSTMRRNIK